MAFLKLGPIFSLTVVSTKISISRDKICDTMGVGEGQGQYCYKFQDKN